MRFCAGVQNRARFHGTELTVNVYGRNDYGFDARTVNGNIMAVRNGNGWEVVAQVCQHQSVLLISSCVSQHLAFSIEASKSTLLSSFQTTGCQSQGKIALVARLRRCLSTGCGRRQGPVTHILGTVH